MKLGLLAGACVFALSAFASDAATLTYAKKVVAESNIGTDSYMSAMCDDASMRDPNSRTNLCNSLGAPDWRNGGGFTETSEYDRYTYYFGTEFTAPSTIWEITGNRASGWTELLDYSFIAANGIGNSVVGTITNNVDGTPDLGNKDRWIVQFDFGGETGPFDRLIVSNAGKSGTRSFDIDAIAVIAAPLPAAAWMLLAGVGGLVVVGRRKKA